MSTKILLPVAAAALLLGTSMMSSPRANAAKIPARGAFASGAASLPNAAPTAALPAIASVPTQVSSDPFTAPTPGFHRTEVETSTASHGTVEVAGFQVGRISNGGGAAIGWATRTAGIWHHGLLPGLTRSTSPAGPYDRATDASAAYDAAHQVWMISTIALQQLPGGLRGVAVALNRSADGINWKVSAPIATATTQDFDKNWTACDNWLRSPYYGHCYTEWDDNASGDSMLMSTSTDGGKTWSDPVQPAGGPTGLGGEPVIQPTGRVIVPTSNGYENAILAYSSHDGGKTWTDLVVIDGVRRHGSAGNLRNGPLPSVAIDAAGKVFVLWQDCRFEPACSANDIVMSTSTDGITWTPPVRLPLSTVGAGIDAFLPGLAVQPGTFGSHARLALIYDFYSASACSVTTCRLNVGYVSSTNGGSTWSAPSVLAGPMHLDWLPLTTDGYMVGDYNTMSFVRAWAIPVFALARQPQGSRLDEFAASVLRAVTGGPLPVTSSPQPSASYVTAAPPRAIHKR